MFTKVEKELLLKLARARVSRLQEEYDRACRTFYGEPADFRENLAEAKALVKKLEAAFTKVRTIITKTKVREVV